MCGFRKHSYTRFMDGNSKIFVGMYEAELQFTLGGGHLNKKIFCGWVGISSRVAEMKSSSQNNESFLVKHDVHGNWQKMTCDILVFFSSNPKSQK